MLHKLFKLTWIKLRRNLYILLEIDDLKKLLKIRPLILLLLRLSLTIRTRTNAAAAASSSTTTSTALLVVLVFGTAFAFHPILSSVSSLSIDFSTLRERARFSSLFFFTLSLPPSFCVKRFKYSQTSANVQQSVLAFFSLYPFLLLYIPIHSQRQKKRRRAHTHSYFTHIYSTMGLSCAMRASRRTVAATAIR